MGVGSDFVALAVDNGFAFTVTTDLNNISGTTEHPYLLLRNPTGSGRKFLFTHALWGVDSASARSTIRFYRDSVITADGTALTPVNTQISSTAPASLAEVFMDPTTSDNGTILNMSIAPNNAPSKGISRWYFLHEGQTLIATVQNSISNASTFADFYWLEDV